MREPPSDPLIQNPIREQFSILTENILALTAVRKEVGPGLVGRVVEREVVAQTAALSELRERVFRGLVSGSTVVPLEFQPARTEVLYVSDFYTSMLANSLTSDPPYTVC